MNSFLLVGITEDTPVPPSQVEALLEAGLDYLYWRKTNLIGDPPPNHFAERILVASATPIPGAHRWHVKEREQAALKSCAPFSTSIHDLAQWPKWAGRATLVFFSPVFPSISKPGYGPSLPLEQLQQQIVAYRSAATEPLPQLIALGGVHAGNIERVQQAGFDGAAVMGSLWKSQDPMAALRDLRSCLR